MGNLNPRRKHVPVTDVLSIVSDGAMATRAMEGLLVPLLILDTSQRPDLDELIRVHEHLGSGDVTFAWAHNPGEVILLLDFIKPIEASVVLVFSIESQAVLVDMILAARALYVQAGRPGDRFRDDVGKPKTIVELPHTGFENVWDDMFLGETARVFRRRGLGRTQAKAAATSSLSQLRELSRIRVNPE